MIKDIERFMRNSPGAYDKISPEESKRLADLEKKRLAEKAFHDEVVKENREKLEKAEREDRERRFIESARLTFFEANPTAKEGDFQRLLPKLKDEFMLDSFRQRMTENSRPEWFENGEFS